MNRWPQKIQPSSASAVFAPFSKQAKLWEPHGQMLRLMAGCGPDQLLDPYKLAPEVQLVLADGAALYELLPTELRNHLQIEAQGKWSGGVYPVALADGNCICILNPRHHRHRHKITLMEEIAHRHMKHSPSKIIVDSTGIKARNYDKARETEAFGIGAAALLPWRSMFKLLNAGNSSAQIAEHFDVSRELVEYRIKISGAFRLYLARRRAG